MRKGLTDDTKTIEDILTRAEVLWLAMTDTEGPHCVPVNFAQDGDILYFHSGKKGRKATALKSGALVAFSAAIDIHMRDGGDNACDQGYFFRSIMGNGVPRLTDGDEKMHGLDLISFKHIGKQLPYKEKILPMTDVYAIDIKTIHARIKG